MHRARNLFNCETRRNGLKDASLNGASFFTVCPLKRKENSDKYFGADLMQRDIALYCKTLRQL